MDPEDANAEEELLPLAGWFSKAHVCVYEETCADAEGIGAEAREATSHGAGGTSTGLSAGRCFAYSFRGFEKA